MEDESLRKMQMEIIMRLLPVASSASVLAIIGLVGNIFVIIFYVRTFKRTLPSLLIKYLAVVDLTTCIMAAPIISEMIINVRYTQSVICKISHFMGNWTIASSGLILVLINIDRYRKICYPLGRQITISAVKYIVIGLVAFALLLSGRLLVTFDIVEVNVTISDRNVTLSGNFCAARCDGRYKNICLVFYILDFMIIVTGIIMCIVMYSRIIYTLLKRRIKMAQSVNAAKSSRRNRKRTNWNSESSFTNDAFSSSGDIRVPEQYTGTNRDIPKDDCVENKGEMFTITGTERDKTKASIQGPNISFDFCSARKPLEWNITLMMFATTVVFLFCFIPYFIIRIFIRLVFGSGREYNFSAWIQFALKLPYLNSAFNPIIYSIFNVKFRRYIKRVILKCCRCHRE